MILSIIGIFKSIFSFILTNWKASLVIIAILYAIIMTHLYISDHNSLKLSQDKIKNYTQSEKTATKIINRYKDSTGASHIQIDANENKIKEEDIIKGVSKNPTIVDTSANLLKIAKDKIVELTKVNAQLVAINLKGYKDTTKGSTLYIHDDKYAHLSFNPVDTSFAFKYNLNLISTKFTKQTGFLNLTRSTILDFYSPDPRITIGGVQHYTVEQEDPSFGAKLSAKGQYNFRTKTITPALTGELNFKNFTIEGNYFYNIGTNIENPTLGVKYTIAKF